MHAGHKASLELPPLAVSCQSLLGKSSISKVNLCSIVASTLAQSHTPGIGGHIIQTAYCRKLSCGTECSYFSMTRRIRDLYSWIFNLLRAISAFVDHTSILNISYRCLCYYEQ